MFDNLDDAVLSDFDNLLSWNLDVSELQSTVEGLHTRPAAAVGHIFLRTIEKVDHFQLLPHTVAADAAARFFWTLHYFRASIEPVTALLKAEPNAAELLEAVQSLQDRIARANELFEDFLERPDATTELAQEIDRSLRQLIRRPEFKRAVSTQLFATVPLLWTAFETLARNLWIAALNHGEHAVAQRAFKAVGDGGGGDGISRRSVSVGILAKHGFDLRQKLGTILESKFKFSSVSGIREAFAATFSKDSSVVDALDAQSIFLLEKHRHLIVHKAGIVDETFQRQTQCDQSVGEEVVLDARTVSEMARGAMDSGCKLLTAIDEWLRQHGGRA